MVRNVKNKYDMTLTLSNENAVPYFDDAILQLISWKGDPIEIVRKALSIDPGFALAHCFLAMAELMGGAAEGHESIRNAKKEIAAIGTECLSIQEKKHIEAFECWSRDELHKACELWEDILLDNPLDLMAIKLSHDAYFMFAKSQQIRDAISRVMTPWIERKDKLTKEFGYLCGMWSFGFEEMNQYERAEEEANKALSINEDDAWAIHTIAHVYEMKGCAKEGAQYLLSTSKLWDKSNILRVHLWWHLSLFFIELHQIEKAINVFDEEIAKKMTESALDLSDASSLLWRLREIGALDGNGASKERCKLVASMWKPRISDHVLAFYDTHAIMALLPAGFKNDVQCVLKSMEAYANEKKGDEYVNRRVSRRVGLPLCKALVSHFEGKDQNVLNLLYPIRTEIITLGGSHAQRDLFNLLIISSAIRCGNNKIARALISEREGLKPNSGTLKQVLSYSKKLPKILEQSATSSAPTIT